MKNNKKSNRLQGKNRLNQFSLNTKAILVQSILIVIPIVLSAFILVYQIRSEAINNDANITYQYDRYIIDSLNTSVRQMESTANTLAGNKLVKDYVSEDDPVIQNELFESNVKNLLKYSYNRYLPTHDISVYPGLTLDDMDFSPYSFVEQGSYRIWAFQEGDDHVKCCFYYQFESYDGTPAVIVMQPSDNLLTDTISDVAATNSQRCAILGADNTLLYAMGSLTPDELERLTSGSGITEGYQILRGNTLSFCIRCDALPLTIVTIQNIDSSLKISTNIYPFLIVCAILVIICITISYQFLYKGITTRIIRLSDACESITLNNIDSENDVFNQTTVPDIISLPSVPVMGNDEIGALSTSINNMLQRITELTNLHAKEVRTTQQVAYDMLAAQIHPHFIYNTIENLRMMAELHEDSEVADQLYALGRMMRLNISDSTSTGDIGMELEHAEMYMQLQKMRLNERLEYTIDPVDKETAKIKCPRFLLQPLVENAIKHGFQELTGTVHVHIWIKNCDEGIRICVHNNGLAINDKRLQEIRDALKKNQPIKDTKGGLGLVNVNTRLRMFFGADSGLTIDSSEEIGTICSILMTIPK